MQEHNKNYSTRSEFLLRKSKLESVPDTKHFGLTSKSDTFPHELRSNNAFFNGHHKTLTRKYNKKHVHLEAIPRLPPIDWRYHNRVSNVKDQGDCGGCFAFASVTVLEYWSSKHHPKSLSPQNIMDCTSGTGRPDVGCNGGLMEYVFEYAKSHPITLEDEFRWTGTSKQCPRRYLRTNVAVKDFRVLMIEDNAKAEQQFEHILHNYGPISVGIDSSNMNNYRGGVYSGNMCTNDIDHAVTIVGYTENAWIIKNSWGPKWGIKGYLYLERGRNACGVAEYAVYVKDAVPSHTKLTTKWHMDA
jgi:C1A family cysteine protease